MNRALVKPPLPRVLHLKSLTVKCLKCSQIRRFNSLDLTSMVAGTKYRGDFEERIKKAMDEVKDNKDVILFIDEIITLWAQVQQKVRLMPPTFSNRLLPVAKFR